MDGQHSDRDSPTDLVAEAITAVEQLERHGGRAVVERKYGLPSNAISRCGFVGVLRVETVGDGFLMVEDGGRVLLIIPAFASAYQTGGLDDLVDLVAIDAKQPNRWWLRTGRAQVLGEWALQVKRAEWESIGWRFQRTKDPAYPLRVFRNPVEWLKGACAGIVVLRPEWTSVLLGGLPVSVGGDDAALGNELIAACGGIERPRVLVDVSAGLEAAA